MSIKLKAYPVYILLLLAANCDYCTGKVMPDGQTQQPRGPQDAKTRHLPEIPKVNMIASPIRCDDGSGEFNFGYVGSKSKNRVTFRIANPLDGDLRIRRTRSECKCMTVANAKDIHVIKAGGTIDIIVDFEAPDEVTQYSKRIILQTYNTDMKYISLRVKADVDMPLAFQENVIDAGVITGGRDVSLEACVLNRGDKDIRLAYATSNSPKCIAAIPREPVKAKGQMSVPVKCTAAKLPGEYKAIVRIQTADEKQKSLTLTVKYKVADPAKKPLDTDKASSASSDHSN